MGEDNVKENNGVIQGVPKYGRDIFLGHPVCKNVLLRSCFVLDVLKEVFSWYFFHTQPAKNVKKYNNGGVTFC